MFYQMYSTIFLMMGNSGGSEQSNPIVQFIPLIGIVVVIYFFMIRPQQKKTKDQKNFKETLKKGDKIVTIGGLHGKILEIKETTFIIELNPTNKIEVEKSAVSVEVTKAYSETPEKK
jgi:preprotein translocase subunit YajC